MMADKNAKLKQFLAEVAKVEKRDSVYTSPFQIERLTKPGSKYMNLNPYEVLQIDPDTTEEDAKKQYRKLSLLCHPDKNPNDKDRAQRAFDAIRQAWEMLNSEEKMSMLGERFEEAKAIADEEVRNRRKEAKAKGQPFDEQQAMKEEFRKQSIKLLAEYEIRKRDLEIKYAETRKRERELEIQEAEERKKKQEFDKNWEQNREVRVSSWRDFKDAKDKPKKSKTGIFRPPKARAEQRDKPPGV